MIDMGLRQRLRAVLGAALVGAAVACAGLTGAGFGGCVVAVVKAEDAARFLPRVTDLYCEATGLRPRAFVCQASAGTTSTASRTRTLHM